MTYIIKTMSGSVEFMVCGDGQPVLVLHGFPRDTNDIVMSLGLELTDFKFIIPNRPGYGKTTLQKNESPEAAADLMILLMDFLSIRTFNLIGISVAGPTALALTARYQSRVNRLLLISAVSKKWLSKTDYLYNASKVLCHPRIELITWNLCRLMAGFLPLHFITILFRLVSLSNTIPESHATELTTMFDDQHSKQGFLNDLDQEVNRKMLNAITSPTLIIHSFNDNFVDVSHALNARAIIESSRSLLLENQWGHLLWYDEEYKGVIKKINTFLSTRE